MNKPFSYSQGSIPRRKFLLTAMLTGLGAGMPPLQAQTSTPNATQLADDLWLISGVGANVLLKKAAAGAVLVDGGLQSHAEDLLALITNLAGSDQIPLLFNTHWHPEQTGLNQHVGQAGGRIFAHANTRQWLGARIERPWEDHAHEALPAQARPNESFHHYGDMEVAGTAVTYGYMRQAHTDGDMYVYFPEENVLHAGGVVASDGWPLVDWWTGGYIGGLPQACETLLEVCNEGTIIVPASGPVMSRAELQEIHEIYSTVHDRVRRMFMAANTVEESIAEKPAAEFEAWLGNADFFIRLAHQSLIPHITPDA